MKNKLLATILLALCSSGAVQAGDWGIFMGVDAWDNTLGGIAEDASSSDTGYRASGYLKIEHYHDSIWLLPNLMLEVTDLSSSSKDSYYDLAALDCTFYYQPLKTDLFNLDIGGTVRKYQASLDDTDYSYNTDPIVYFASKLKMPNTGISLFTQGNFGDIGHDYRAGLSFELSMVPLIIRGGYREVELELSEVDIKQTMSGPFIGFGFHF